MLQFIGNGSAFNTKLGNNAAFYKNETSLMLIDCGSSTFERLQKANLLDGVKRIEILVTHFHPDHIGSLGDLIFYSYFVTEATVTIYTPQKESLQSILKAMGVSDVYYHITQLHVNTYFTLRDFDILVKPHYTFHDSKLTCYGYKLIFDYDTNPYKVYYSGDASEIPFEILSELKSHKINIFYQDTCKAHYQGNVHLSLQLLAEIIEPQYRHMVWCMHLDGSFDRSEAESLGFNVTRNVLEIIVSAMPLPLIYSGYKAGQTVVVRNDLVQGGTYRSRNTDNKYEGSVVEKMMKFAGKKVTIKQVVYEEDGFYYIINEDDGLWNWTDMMFE